MKRAIKRAHKRRNAWAVHAFNRGHSVEPDRKKEQSKKACKGKVNE